MATQTQAPLPASSSALRERADRGLLLTESPALARAFRRELRNCAECTTAFEVHPALDAALANDAGYRWIAVDLDATLAPSEAIRQARTTWPNARLAVLSCWWSERDAIARNIADTILHKPVRSAELIAFLRGVTTRDRAV